MTTSDLDQLAWELEAAGSAHPRDAARYTAVLERAVHAYTTDPAAHEVFDLGDLYLDLATEYEQLGRIDDALDAADAVVATGLKMHPDARCLRAEILMRAGRVDEAEPIWAAVRAADPEDVWLYNAAALEYAEVGADETALDWLTDGLRLALRTGDPELLVGQLADLRRSSLDNLGRSADQLQDMASVFLRDQEQSRHARTAEPTRPSTTSRMAMAWLPAGDYEQALELWPNFAESDLIATEDGPLSHVRYCRAMQQKLVAFSDAGQPTFTVVPIRIAQYTAWCAEHNHQPGSADARAEYVAHLTTVGDPNLTAWPPGRNDRCWCGSGVKYKKCCASVSFDGK